MKRPLAIFLTLAVFAAEAGRLFAQDTNSQPAAQDTNSGPVVMDRKYFEIISTRNVFDPARSGRRPSIGNYRPRRVDSFTLAGIMSYEKGDYAFFDGSNSDYRKTVRVGQSIAGYKVAEIKPAYVNLQASSNKFVRLNVGTQMRRVEGGRWAFSGRVDPSAVTQDDSGDSSPAQPDATTAPSIPAGSGAESEILKRMMMNRLNEK
jgi:hypothetical protein